MRKSEQNCMTRKTLWRKEQKQYNTIAQRAAQYNAKWNEIRLF